MNERLNSVGDKRSLLFERQESEANSSDSF